MSNIQRWPRCSLASLINNPLSCELLTSVYNAACRSPVSACSCLAGLAGWGRKGRWQAALWQPLLPTSTVPCPASHPDILKMKYVTGFPVCGNSMARKLFDKNGKIWKHTRSNLRANRKRSCRRNLLHTPDTAKQIYVVGEASGVNPSWHQHPKPSSITGYSSTWYQISCSSGASEKGAKGKWERSGGIHAVQMEQMCPPLGCKVLCAGLTGARSWHQSQGTRWRQRASFSFRSSGVTTVNFFFFFKENTLLTNRSL